MVGGLFGIELSRPLMGVDDVIWHWDYLSKLRDLNHARLVEFDVPSATAADTGDVGGADVTHPVAMLPSDVIVTFDTMKPGHASAKMHRLGGQVVVKDIGL